MARPRSRSTTTSDETNGINTVAVAWRHDARARPSYLRTNCTRPWSNLRAYLGLTDPRQNVAQSVAVRGQARIQQFMERDGFGITLDIEIRGDRLHVQLADRVSRRRRPAAVRPDRRGSGSAGLETSRSWAAYIAFINAKYGTRPATSNNGQFLFAQPVGEDVDVEQFSQEFRLHVQRPRQPLRLDRGPLLQERRHRQDRPLHRRELPRHRDSRAATIRCRRCRARTAGSTTARSRTTRASRSSASSSPTACKLSVGVRYTHDKKEGDVSGLVVATGDRFSPNDPRAERDDRRPVPHADWRRSSDRHGRHGRATCLAPNQWIYSAGTGFQTDYSEELERDHAAGDARVDGRATTLFLYARLRKASRAAASTTRRPTSRRRSRRSIPKRRRTTRSASRRTCSTAACA